MWPCLIAIDSQMFEDERWTVRLALEGEKRLKRNNDKRTGRVFSYSGDVMEGADLRDPFDLEHQIAEKDALERLLSCLTEKQRQVVLLSYVHGLTQEEIASRLGIGRRAVGNSLEAALKRMRKF